MSCTSAFDERIVAKDLSTGQFRLQAENALQRELRTF